MDSGHLEPGETLEDEYDVLRDISPAEVIGIMDQILCHEVSTLLWWWIPKIERGVDPSVGCMAHGSSTLTDSLHMFIYRTTPVARAEDAGRSSVFKWAVSCVPESIAAPDSTFVLYCDCQGMSFRAYHDHGRELLRGWSR